ncbi:response regulator transcription factor [Corynebacterium glutamicum]|uniref:response regulator transcription factor n=1 Tax=Corynebacterium glutamicum TaxID=1718 RepID=UPI000B3D00F3|nr:response regulator transcription factor [Corynebacterium glutamicum]ARV66035.1 two-component system response regulator [Corynebacterium glutamicum]
MLGPIQVLIVDDEPFFINALETYFSTNENINVVATAENGVQALDILSKTIVDVVLCDVCMPLLSGVELMKILAEKKLTCRVLALTSFLDDYAMLSMLQFGAFGFLLKSADRDEIIEAVQSAAMGGTTISPEIATNLRKFLSQPPSSISDLPTRERDVLTLLHLGKSNADIAAELKLSTVSVKKSVSRLMQRFQVSSRLELVASTRL